MLGEAHRAKRDPWCMSMMRRSAGIRVAGRGGADTATLTGIADMVLRALR
jgi:hypothetical protein